jgi:hypothetical protein
MPPIERKYREHAPRLGVEYINRRVVRVGYPPSYGT